MEVDRLSIDKRCLTAPEDSIDRIDQRRYRAPVGIQCVAVLPCVFTRLGVDEDISTSKTVYGLLGITDQNEPGRLVGYQLRRQLLLQEKLTEDVVLDAVSILKLIDHGHGEGALQCAHQIVTGRPEKRVMQTCQLIVEGDCAGQGFHPLHACPGTRRCIQQCSNTEAFAQPIQIIDDDLAFQKERIEQRGIFLLQLKITEIASREQLQLIGNRAQIGGAEIGIKKCQAHRQLVFLVAPPVFRPAQCR